MNYVVQAGDTLYDIAQTYLGDGNLYPQIVAANPQITDPNLIQVGQTILIPTSAPATTIPGTPIPLSPVPAKAGLNSTVLVGALLIGVVAAGYWWMHSKVPAIAHNPEIEDEEIDEDEDE